MNNKEIILKVLNKYNEGNLDDDFDSIANEIEIILSEKYNEGYANGYANGYTNGANDVFSAIRI